MNISLPEARQLRRMNSQEIRCIHELCRHSETSHDLFRSVKLPDGTRHDVLRCRKCLRWWLAGERTPPPGNPALAPFREPCKHARSRTLPGTDDKNQCMECDSVYSKTDAAIAWKRIRDAGGILCNGLENTISTTYHTMKTMMREVTRDDDHSTNPRGYGESPLVMDFLRKD